MAKQKQPKFSAATEARRVARDRIGAPRSTRVVPGKRSGGRSGDVADDAFTPYEPELEIEEEVEDDSHGKYPDYD